MVKVYRMSTNDNIEFGLNTQERFDNLNEGRNPHMFIKWIDGWEGLYAFDPAYNQVRSFYRYGARLKYRVGRKGVRMKVCLRRPEIVCDYSKAQLIYWFWNPDYQFREIVRRIDIKGGFNIENLFIR